MISLGCDNLLVEIARYYSVEETRCMIFLSYTALPALHCIAGTALQMKFWKFPNYFYATDQFGK